MHSPVTESQREAFSAAVDKAGGAAQLADALRDRTRGHVTRYQVMRWRRIGVVPAELAIPVEAITGVRRELLRPDVYIEGKP